MSVNRRTTLNLLAVAGLAAASRPAAAQAGRTVTLLVGYPPGGAVDVVAREFAEAMRAQGFAIVVENRTGAAGRLATEQMLSAPADGSTLVFMPGGNATIFPHVYRNLKHDPLKDLVALGAVCEFSFALGVGSGTPARTLPEFVEWAKANPGKASYGTPGGGTAMHFMGAMFGRAAGFEFTHVPYRGGAAAIVDVMGGTVPALASTLPLLVPPHRQGKLRILAFTGERRLDELPEVPTFKEHGYPDLVITETFGVFGASRMPAARQAELDAAIRKAAADPRVTAALRKQEFAPLSLSQGEYAARLKRDHARWGPVIKATGYTADD
jgi:tripartite-type tricarboxylate transporter receptor subunit TctC